MHDGLVFKWTAVSVMYMWQVCLENFTKDVCDDLYSSENSDALDTVQASSSHWVLGSTLTLSFSSIITAQFLGSWSDTYGRKVPMLLPPLGKMVLKCIDLCLSSLLFGMYSPIWAHHCS